MVVTLGKNAPSYSMVKKWNAEFKHDRESLEDDPCLRRSVTVITLETIAKIHDIIMADRRVTEEHFIASELGTVSTCRQVTRVDKSHPLIALSSQSLTRS